MVKGYCTNCNKENEARRIFDVNSDTRFCYCPHCGKKYRPKVAIANYQHTISKYLKKARFFLSNAGEVQYAYNLYAYVLELEPENRTAKLGRLLSLAFLSTVRRNRFIEVLQLLEIEKDLFHDKVFAHEQYNEFLIHLENCTETYLINVKKALTLKGYFYDVDCIKLYFKHIKDVIELRRLIVSELMVIGVTANLSIISDETKDLEKQYNMTCMTVDGRDHSLAHFAKNGEPIIISGVKQEDTHLSRYRMSTLDVNNKKKLNVIPEKAFPVFYSRIYRTSEIALPLAIVNMSIAVTLLVFYFIFIKLACAPYIMGTFIFFLIVGLSFLTLKIVFGLLLKKARL